MTNSVQMCLREPGAVQFGLILIWIFYNNALGYIMELEIKVI